MFQNYLAAALRNLLRNRLYTVINVVGLGIAFAGALLIALFIRDELSYDRFFDQSERVYRVYAVGKPPVDGLNESEQTETGVVQWLPLAFPEIERAASLVKDKRAIRRGEFEVEEEVTWATEDFFEIFRPPGGWVVGGDPIATLKQPGSVVLTRSMARKYFGRDDAVGGMLEMDRKTPLRVGAVIEDLPSNTHLKLGIIGVAGPDFQSGEWPSTYVKLAASASPARIQQGMASAIDRHMPLQSVDTGRGQTLRWRWTQQMYLLPLADVHLHRVAGGGRFEPARDLRVIGALAAIGALIVLVAIINFVNLMTARASRRSVEVGIRKAAGARRGDLIVQFIGESLIYALLGLALAVSLVELVLPWVDAFLHRSIEMTLGLALAALVATLLTAGLGGLYPALVAIAGGVAVFIACLGLLGLASYLAERRRKEMGIRKASGAGKGDIFRLMLWELVRPVVWANVIAWPAAYWVLSRWLSGMAYHIELGIGLFAAAGGLALAIAVLTVGQQAWSLAQGRAMAALRYE